MEHFKGFNKNESGKKVEVRYSLHKHNNSSLPREIQKPLPGVTGQVSAKYSTDLLKGMNNTHLQQKPSGKAQDASGKIKVNF